VVDSNDRERILEARDELHRMLSEVNIKVLQNFLFNIKVKYFCDHINNNKHLHCRMNFVMPLYLYLPISKTFQML